MSVSRQRPREPQAPTPRCVHGYEVLRELGRGGMATVLLARQIELDRLVALKQLDGLSDESDARVRRFVRESRLAGSLSHPNIVTVYDSFEADGVPYIAMELVPGGTLREILHGLSLEQVVGVLDGALAGLTHAERRGVVHRDLKPENLMVSGEGQIKITDFGIAKATGEARTAASMLTSVGTAVGTPAYMAPEQAMGQAVGPQTDLYSLGVVAFEMLVGHVPFEGGESSVSVLLQHVNEPPPAVDQLRPEVDPELSAWVANLLVKEPEERPESALAAHHALEDIVLRLRGPRWRRDAPLPVFADAASDESTTASGVMPPAPATGVIGESGACADARTAAARRAEPRAAHDGPAAPHGRVPPRDGRPATHRPSLPWGRGLVLLLGVVAVLLAAGVLGGRESPSTVAAGAGQVARGPATAEPSRQTATSPAADALPAAPARPPTAGAAPPAAKPPTPVTSAVTPGVAGVAVDAGRVGDAERQARRFDEEAQDTEGDGDESLTKQLRDTAYAYRDAAAAGKAGDGSRFSVSIARADELAALAIARLDG